MTETRDFPTAAIVSLTTGRLLCNFSDMHEIAEYLMGHPIWTHHFADKELWDEMKRTVAAQHPGLPMNDPEDVSKENYLEYVKKLEAEFGPTLRIQKGSGLTAQLPTDGIPDHLKDKTIIVDVGS